jgi:hypothetical protein
VPIIFCLIPVPAPTVWPTITKSTSQLRTAVSNKVIFRTGILESVEAFDGGSLVKTTNWKWDKLTGAMVVTYVNNNFDNPVYSYSAPAFREYQGMGAAYQNLGLTFNISALLRDPYKVELYRFYTSLAAGILQPGDEILLYPIGTYASPIARVVYTGNMDGDDILYTEGALSATEYSCMIVRSGYRNQLSVSSNTITALQDPSVKGTTVNQPAYITVPR